MQKTLIIGIFVLFFGCAGKEAVKEVQNDGIEKDTFTTITPNFWGATVNETTPQINAAPRRARFAPPPTMPDTISPSDTVIFTGRFQTVLAGEAFDMYAAVYVNPTDSRAYKAGLTQAKQAQGVATRGAAAPGDTLQIMTRGVIYNFLTGEKILADVYSAANGGLSYSKAPNAQKLGYINRLDFYVEIEPFTGELVQTNRKGDDSTISISTTLTDDADLQVSLDSASTYEIEVVAWVNAANSAMGYKYGTRYTGSLSSSYYYTTHTVPGDISGIATNQAGTGLIEGVSVSGATSGAALVKINYIVNTTTAGVFSFRWAQNMSSASALKVLKGSHIKYTKI